MSAEIKVPVLPESVSEGTLGAWHKNIGDQVKQDEPIVDLETDKVVLEIVATANGVLQSIEFNEGDIVTNDQVLGIINTDAVSEQKPEPVTKTEINKAGPAVRKLIKENDLKLDDIQSSGKKSGVTKADVEQHIQSKEVTEPKQPAASSEQTTSLTPASPGEDDTARNDRRVPMSRLRRVIADRLKQAQNTAAILSTFNEVNLKPMMDLRSKYRDSFEKKHGVKLGMMSFFTKAAIEGLKRFPTVNASIDGADIVYHDYFDIGMAVSSDRGLVVPILRDADQLSYADIELRIREMAARARDGKLSIDELTGGTFSITNGGVFGSLLSTPILNPPQSAILGMHTIQQRPVAIDGEIVIRPMMYLALSYDHRIIDGREAVQFLVTIKEALEDPARMLLNI